MASINNLFPTSLVPCWAAPENDSHRKRDGKDTSLPSRSCYLMQEVTAELNN
jgi:hypothetical protein